MFSKKCSDLEREFEFGMSVLDRHRLAGATSLILDLFG
jgi:hypothetical protein